MINPKIKVNSITNIYNYSQGRPIQSNNFIFANNMSKYKTIMPSSHRQSLHQSIERKLIDYSVNRNTISSNGQEPLMSTNKSIVYIKLPKKNLSNINHFKSSLYQASIRHFKHNSNRQKEIKIRYIQPKKKKFQEFQEEVLRQYNLEKSLSRKMLPTVQSPSQKKHKQKPHINIFFDEKSNQKQQLHEDRINKSRQLTLNADKKPSFLDIEDTVFGYQNLKDKYLVSKQNSLINKRKFDIIQKYQSRSSLAQQHDYVPRLSPYKSKEIEEHMNRYKQKDLFQTKLTGFKTNLHPVERSLKFRPSWRQGSQFNEPQFSNFVKRKKLKSTALYLNTTQTEQRRAKANQQERRLIQNDSKIMQCTPWQTEGGIFD